jgi:hypothetical protein
MCLFVLLLAVPVCAARAEEAKPQAAGAGPVVAINLLKEKLKKTVKF